MDWLSLGYVGLFIVSFLSATVIPFSSDAIVAVMTAMDYNLWLLLIVASAGNTLGGMTNYYIGRLGKTEWIRKYLRISEKKIERASMWAKKYTGYVAFFSWLPGIGDALALVLGLFKAKQWQVWLYMFIGKTARYAVIIFLVQKVIQLFQ